jgi:hypothetical protein
MKIACMQPYFLPYIGYWQLINAVDRFIILDDVQYITKGWINRNKIIINGKEQWITIPLKNKSRNKMINQLDICEKELWTPKLKRTIKYNFQKCDNYNEGERILNDICNHKDNKLINFLVNSIFVICEYLELKTEILLASRTFPKCGKIGEERIIDICRKCSADTYINLPGGKELYRNERFLKNGIKLDFIETKKTFSTLLQSIIQNGKGNVISDLT